MSEPSTAAASTVAATADEPVRIVHAACPHDCPDTCAIRVTMQGERVLRWQGDPDHAPTAGALCTKVSRYLERVEHPERLLQPLKRVGPKGSGRFEPVGWDEALADIAQRLQAIAARDPQAILPYSYAGTMGVVQGEGMAARFFNRLGASRLDRTICASAGGAALAATYGARVGMPIEDFNEAKLLLIWGSHSIASNLHFWRRAQAARRAGAKLVCIDPRRTETADHCDVHIALRPGTDGALALGLMHELIVHGWLDQAYIDRATEGWPALCERALAWPPERVAQVCGIPADQVRQLAHDYAHIAPAAIRLNYGVQRARGGGNAVRLIAILPALIGAWQQRGGGMLLSSSGWAGQAKQVAALERPELLAGRAPRTLNMSTIGDALLAQPGDEVLAGGPRIEALVVYNSNPVAVAPESAKVVAGFAREDLFTVVLEHFLTDTADHADYVLPATMQTEHLDIHASYGHADVLINQPAMAPRGACKPNSQVFRELAARMGYTEACFADSDEDLARTAFAGTIDYEQLCAVGWQRLPVPERLFADGRYPTPSGRLQITAPGLGVPDFLPPWESAEGDPALAARYPLAMISPPARNFLNSTFVNVKSLRDIEREPVLELCAEDAAARGIADGDAVRVYNDRGSYHCTARLNGRARAGVVNGLGIWWRKLGPRGTNVNELTHQRLTDMGRAPCFYDCLVEVERA